MLVFDRSKLRAQLLPLSQEARFAFGLLTFERIFPCFSLSSKLVGGFDMDPLLAGRDLAWACAFSNPQIGPATTMAEEIFNYGPNSEDYGAGLYVPCAISAVSAMHSLLNFVVEHDPEDIVWIAVLATDCIYMCLDEISTPVQITDAFVASVFAHPVMLAELRRQDEDIEFVRELEERSQPDKLSLLRERASTQSPVLAKCAECVTLPPG